MADEFDVVVVESSDRLAWNNRADHVESGQQLAHRRWEALHETGEAAWDDLGDAEKAGWRPEIAVVIPSVNQMWTVQIRVAAEHRWMATAGSTCAAQPVPKAYGRRPSSDGDAHGPVGFSTRDSVASSSVRDIRRRRPDTC